MTARKRVATGLAALASVGALGIGAGSASAAPNWSDCPVANLAVRTCIDIQSTGGSMVIKGFETPLDHSMNIRGGLMPVGGALAFVPPEGTTGVFAEPIQIPGGLLGLDLPLWLNEVTATAERAGNGPIVINPNTASVSVPIKLNLDNPLLAPNCSIGTDANPIQLNLITGTTNPPPPNQPITGQVGTVSISNGVIALLGNIDVDNSFAVPGASGCGLLGLNNLAINLKLGLPSAAGNNTITVVNDVFTVSATRVRDGLV